MYSKSKVLVATVTHATLYAFASDVARSCKSSVHVFTPMPHSRVAAMDIPPLKLKNFMMSDCFYDRDTSD